LATWSVRTFHAWTTNIFIWVGRPAGEVTRLGSPAFAIYSLGTVVAPGRSERLAEDSVCAVVPQGDERLERSLAAQTHQPVAVVRAAALLGSGLAAVRAQRCEWIWLLDGRTRPRADALEQLLRSLDVVPPLPPPVLLVSKVVRPDGTLEVRLAPWFRRGQTQVTMLSVSRRMLPVRAAYTASLLVRSDAVSLTAGPRAELPADAAALEWTARLLRSGFGYLAPASVAEVRDVPDGVASGWLDQGPLGDARIVAAMLTSRGWHPKEKLWLVPEIVAGSARSAAGQLARGVWRAPNRDR